MTPFNLFLYLLACGGAVIVLIALFIIVIITMPSAGEKLAGWLESRKKE